MPRLVQAPVHKAEVNWVPLSVVTVAGTGTGTGTVAKTCHPVGLHVV
jgi:hypothetical protein